MGPNLGMSLSINSASRAKYGPDLILNGGPTSDTIWTKGADWTFATDRWAKAAGAGSALAQDAAWLVAGTTYFLEYSVERSAGAVYPQLIGGASVDGGFRTASGDYAENITAVSGNVVVRFLATTTFIGTVRNIRMRKINF